MTVLGLALLGGPAGCDVKPPGALSTDLGFKAPGGWVAVGGEGRPILDQWWASFKDKGLNDTIAEALASNHDLKAAAARIETAAAESRIAGADFHPQLNGGFGSSRSRSNNAGPGGAVTPLRTSNLGVSLDVSWEMDVWGRVRSAVRATAANFQATQADYAAAMLSVAGQTAKAWVTVVEARQQIALTERTVATYRETARQASDRVKAGISSRTDKYLAAANLASAEGLLQQRRETLARARRQLEVLLGRYPDGRVDSAAKLPVTPPLPPVGLPADIIRRRPDLVAAERQLAASIQRVDASQKALYPRFSLTASTGTSSDELRNLLDGDYLIWTIAGNLVQPLFQGGRLRARIDAEKGRAEEATARFAQQAIQAFSEVEIALATTSLLADREQALQKASEEAIEAVKVSHNRYAQGVENFLVVLESQRRALDAESAVLAVRRQRLTNRIDLHLALGGGFEAFMPSVPAIADNSELTPRKNRTEDRP